MRRIHEDVTGCTCSRCEPAEGTGGTLGAQLSGNPACDWPSCGIRGEQCMWGEKRCFDEDLARTIRME